MLGGTSIKVGYGSGATPAGRFQEKQGANVTAANDTTLSLGGNFFVVTGNTTINGIATARWRAGSQVMLKFTGTPTLKHNTGASVGFASLLLSGAVDFAVSATNTITFVFDGTTWTEVARANIGVAAQTYAATNVSTDRAYDANATTIDELADVLGTLIADLRALWLVV